MTRDDEGTVDADPEIPRDHHGRVPREHRRATEVAAFTRILELLEPLDRPSRDRVLGAVSGYFVP